MLLTASACEAKRDERRKSLKKVFAIRQTAPRIFRTHYSRKRWKKFDREIRTLPSNEGVSVNIDSAIQVVAFRHVHSGWLPRTPGHDEFLDCLFYCNAYGIALTARSK